MKNIAAPVKASKSVKISKTTSAFSRSELRILNQLLSDHPNAGDDALAAKLLKKISAAAYA